MDDKIETFLKCSMCKERFQGLPKRLPCQHSVCESPCAEALMKGNSYECPQCNEKHTVSTDGTIDLPTDKVLQQHLSLYLEYDTLPVTRAEGGAYVYSDDYDQATSQGSQCVACANGGNIKCLHCGKNLCSTACKDSHMDQIREMVLETSAKIHESMERLTELEECVGLILKYNPSVAANKDLKRHFQTFEHQKFEIDKYLTSLEKHIGGRMDDAELLAHMFQCKDHHSALVQVEFSQLILDLKRELEKHSPRHPGTDPPVIQRKGPIKAETSKPSNGNSSPERHNKTPPVPPRAGNKEDGKLNVAVRTSKHDHVVTDVTNEPEDRTYDDIDIDDETSCDQRNPNTQKSLQPLGLYSKLAVCSVTNVMSCFRIGIGIWNLVQHSSKMNIVTACFLILKTLFETGCIYWFVLHKFGNGVKIREYILMLALLVLLGLMLILDTVLAYTADYATLSHRVLRIVTIIDWVWTIVILLSIWMLASKCFRN